MFINQVDHLTSHLRLTQSLSAYTVAFGFKMIPNYYD